MLSALKSDGVVNLSGRETEPRVPKDFGSDTEVPRDAKTRHTPRIDIRRKDHIRLELCGSLVPVMRRAETRMGEDRTVTAASRSACGRLFTKHEMRPVLVVIAAVLSEQPFQMLLVDGNDMIQQIATATLDSARRDVVLPRILK